MLITIQSSSYECVRPGIYTAEFCGLVTCETANGKAYRWQFTITDGEYKDKPISELSDANSPATPKNKTGRFLAAIGKAELKAGVQVDPDSYVGKRYMVFCEQKEGGGSKITTFSQL